MANTIEMVIKASDKASSELRKVSGEVTNLGKAANDAGKGGVSSLGENITRMGASVLGAVGILGGFAVAAKKAFDMAEEGAQITQTAESFDGLIESIGAAPDLLNQLSAASRGTISEFDMMSSTMTLLAGASGELVGKLADATPELMAIAKAANKLNPALGDTNFLYQSLATGIKRASPMILDNLGLIIKVGEANETYAASIGKAADQLTAEEQKIALLNETLRAGGVLMEQAGGNADSAADAFMRLKVALEESGGAIKQRLAPALANAAEAMALLLTWHGKVRDALKEQETRLENTSDSYEDYALGIIAAASAGNTALSGFVERTVAIDGEAAAISMLAEQGLILTEVEWALGRSAAGTTEAMAGAAVAAFRLAGDAQAAAGGMGDASQAATDGTGAFEDAAAAMREASAAAGALGDELSNLDVSAKDSFKAIIAQAEALGLTDAQVIKLAGDLGIAGEAQVAAALAQRDMNAALADGTMSLEQVTIAAQHLDEWQRLLEESSALLKDGETEAAAAAQEHASAQLELASTLVESASKADEHSSALARIPPSVSTEVRTPGLYDALIAVRDFKGALDALPREKKVTIIQEYVTTRSGQTPGQEDDDDDLPGHAAGTNYVPFTGPAILHQGEMVIPAAQAANMRRGGGGGGMIVLAPVILDAGAYTDATGSVAYSDIGSVVLQRLEGTL